MWLSAQINGRRVWAVELDEISRVAAWFLQNGSNGIHFNTLVMAVFGAISGST
jgi:hypothetical protein